MNIRQSVTQRWSKLLGCSIWFWTSVAGAQQTAADPPQAPDAPATEAPAPDAPAEGSPADGSPLLGTPLPLTDASRAELNDYIAAALVSFDVPGAAVALIHNGDIEYTACFGVRDVDQPEAIDLETRFMIGSVTKTLTRSRARERLHAAAAAARLRSARHGAQHREFRDCRRGRQSLSAARL